MATRYWVGGAGNWSSTAKWSTTSGGTSGASVPTSADDVIFDANSGGKFTATVDTAQSVNSITITPSATVGVLQIALSAQLTTGNLTTTGTAGNNRIWFRGTTYGIAQNFVVNGTVNISDCDFRDLYVTGTAAPISGTRIGDRGNCRGITFSTPKTVYWNLSGAQNWSANGWATTSTGTPSTDHFPLPQDTATFTNAGSVTGTITLDAAISYVSNVDMSGRTNAMTLGISNATTVYGSWTNGSGTAFTGTATLTFSGNGTQTITSAGKTFSSPITVDSYGGTVQLADALNIGSNALTVGNGTFDTKGYNVTATAISSSNSNVRTISLGASTVTLSDATPLVFTTFTNLTFNSGTSTIVCTSPNVTFTGNGFTFYNVTIGGSLNESHVINGANTFNNLTFVNRANTGTNRVAFGANQVINGTFTVNGTQTVIFRRYWIRSSVPGTQRTITAAAINIFGVDFQDINAAGAASWNDSSRTKYWGDTGNNSGVTFSAGRSVYWNLAGTQNWTSTGWALTNNGTPAAANYPLVQDTATFTEAGAAGTIALDTQGLMIGNVTMADGVSNRSTAMTLSFGAYDQDNFFGNITLFSNLTLTAPGIFNRAIRLSGYNVTQDITSAGRTFPLNVAVGDGYNNTVRLQDDLSVASTMTLSLAAGSSFNANNFNVTTGLFSLSGGTLRMGSGTWTLSGTGTVWNMGTPAAFYKGTANIVLSDTSTTARTFAGNGLSYNKLTIGGTTGTSTTTISGNNQFTELASTKTVAHTIGFGTTTQTFGKWTVTGTAGNVVTLTGTGTGHILAGACTSGIDYLAMGSIGFASTSPGEFYAGANSTGTAGAPVYRTAKPADSTRYWVGGTGNWSDTARWSTSSGGAGGASVPRSHDDVVFNSASNATAYTATVDTVTGGIRMKSLTIAGPASGNLTLSGGTAINGIHGNVTLPATGLTRTYTGAITLSSNLTGLTFTTNGVALASNITVNGVNCVWNLGSALDGGSSTITVTNGSFDLVTYNLTAGAISSDNGNSRTIDFGSGTTVLSAGTPISFGTTETNRASLTVTAGTSQINCSNAASTINGNNQTFYNVSFTSTSAATRAITGANTFNDLTLTASANGLSQLSISANQTINGTFTCAGSASVNRGFVRSDTIGTARTLTVATLSANDCDFRDITIAGAAAGAAPTRAGDCGGNSGITFPAAKTVYRVGTNTSWGSSTDWSATSGGSGAGANFPLAQDTAVINEDTTLTGTLSLISAYNFPALDCSTRTTGITLNYNVAGDWYGSHTLGSGVTVSGTSAQTFSGRGAMTFTSAGKTIAFPITVDAPGGTFQLGDAFSSSNTTTHTRGTFNANSYNLTCTTFGSNNSNTRTITMGSGLWTLSGTGTVWDSTTTTGLTFNKDTANILLSDTSTTARTFAGGGLSYNKLTIGGATGISTTTITGNNTLTELASNKTVASTISLGTTTQRIGSWTVKGTAGNVETVTGTSASSPCTLIFTGTGTATASDVDYLTITGVRAYSLTDTWYAGANSTNNGSLGWYFQAGVTPSVATGNFFLLLGM